MNRNIHRIAQEIETAIARNEPIVALESTVIAHGLPHPINLETALGCEQAVRDNNSHPATVGVVAGVPTIGLDRTQIEAFASAHETSDLRIEKVGLNNLAGVVSAGGWGATTVATTLKLAHATGIRVFSTGGIGGVHRGAETTFDVSGDLTALANTPIICVCSGAKAILDLPKTIEYLETMGIPAVGYKTNELPSFYSRRSGIPLDLVVDGPRQAADLALRHWELGFFSAVLLCVPPPEDIEISSDKMNRLIEAATGNALREAIRGKALTPFLLSELKRLTNDETLATNRGLLINNAAVAAKVSVELNAALKNS